MAPPVKPDDERKAPCAVSLTRKQRETFKKMGGSAWLQNLLDAEAALMAKGRKALPHFVRLDTLPSWPEFKGEAQTIAAPAKRAGSAYRAHQGKKARKA